MAWTYASCTTPTTHHNIDSCNARCAHGAGLIDEGAYLERLPLYLPCETDTLLGKDAI